MNDEIKKNNCLQPPDNMGYLPESERRSQVVMFISVLGLYKGMALQTFWTVKTMSKIVDSTILHVLVYLYTAYTHTHTHARTRHTHYTTYNLYGSFTRHMIAFPTDATKVNMSLYNRQCK